MRFAQKLAIIELVNVLYIGLVLQKLREIATLPSAAYLSSPGPRITSSLLLRLSQNCLGSDLGDRHCSWPPPTSGYLNWKEYFTQPVQDTVTLVRCIVHVCSLIINCSDHIGIA